MSDRDDLARLLEENADDMMAVHAWYAADVVWAAGWRKMPSRIELTRAVSLAYALAPRDQVNLPKQLCRDDYDGQMVEATSINMGPVIDAILALMDGPTETGEGNE